MNEYTQKTIKLILAGIFVLACIALVIYGHTIGFSSEANSGMIGLGLQLVGLTGILIMLYLYNRSQK